MASISDSAEPCNPLEYVSLSLVLPNQRYMYDPLERTWSMEPTKKHRLDTSLDILQVAKTISPRDNTGAYLKEYIAVVKVSNDSNRKIKLAYLLLNYSQQGDNQMATVIFEKPPDRQDDTFSKLLRGNSGDVLKGSTVTTSVDWRSLGPEFDLFNNQQSKVSFSLLKPVVLITPNNTCSLENKVLIWEKARGIPPIKQPSKKQRCGSCNTVIEVNSITAPSGFIKSSSKRSEKYTAKAETMESTILRVAQVNTVPKTTLPPTEAINHKEINTSISMNRIHETLNEVKNSPQLAHIGEESRDTLLGVLATSLFQSTTWRLEPPQTKAYTFSEATIDIDQVSLTVSLDSEHIKQFINKQITGNGSSKTDSVHRYYSNDNYLEALHTLFEEELYKKRERTSPVDQITITKQNLFGQMNAHKGGHTYMTPKTKKEYKLLYQKQGGDVFRMSIAFTPATTSSSSSPDLELIVSTDEKEFLTNYKTEENKNERVWIAIKLVARWFMETKGNLQGWYISKQITQTICETKKEINVVGGELFYLLVVMQLAQLEALYNTGFCVSLCLETYGGKLRKYSTIDLNNNNITSSESGKEIIERLIEANNGLSCNLIAQISTFFAEKLEIASLRQNKLVWGVGLTYGLCSDGKRSSPLFGVLTLPPYYRKSNPKEDILEQEKADPTYNGDEEKNQQSENDDTDDINDNENVACDDNEDIPEESISQPSCSATVTQSLYERIKSGEHFKRTVCHHYYLMSGLLPEHVRPFTLKLNVELCDAILTRIQHYFVCFRYPIGEGGLVTKISELAGILANSFKKTNDVIKINFGSIMDKCRDFRKCMVQTLNNCKTRGNCPRVEIACTSTNPLNNIKSLFSAIQNLICVVKNETVAYDCNVIHSCMDFFSLSLLYKMENLRCAIDNQHHFETLKCLDVINLIQEIHAHSRTLSNGRYQLIEAGKIYGVQFSRFYDRPVLDHYATEGMKEIANKALEGTFMFTRKESDPIHLGNSVFGVSNDHCITLEEWFFRRLGLPYPLPQPAQLKAVQGYVEHLHWKVCSVCFKLFNSTNINAFESHFCFESNNKHRHILDDNNDRVKERWTQSYSSLSFTQKIFIQQVLRNEDNLFLTGMAGTGKSRTLCCAIYALQLMYGDKIVGLVSSTKNAASIIGGTTLHSFFGLTTEKFDSTMVTNLVDKFGKTSRYGEVGLYLKYLFIDEVGLLSSEAIFIIDRMLKAAKKNNEYFGGVRVYLCGDVLQLPPIMEQSSSNNSPAKFFFQSECFTRSGFKVHYLTDVFRQQHNSEWVTMLNKVRRNEVTESDITYLNSRLGAKVPVQTVEHTFKVLADLCDEQLQYVSSQEAYNRFGRQTKDLKLHEQNTLLQKMFRFGQYEQKWLNRIATLNEDCFLPTYFGQTSQYENTWRAKYPQIVKDKKTMMTARLNELRQLQGNDPEPVGVELQSFVICCEKKEVSALAKCPVYAPDPTNPNCRGTYYTSLAVDIPNNNPALSSLLDKDSNLEKKVTLVIGQRVLFTKNNISTWISNNGFGIVKELVWNNTNPNQLDAVVVQPLSNDSKLSCPLISIQRIAVRCTQESEMFGTQEATRTQFPLRPADTGTTYAVQGMTFNELPCIMNNERAQMQRSYGYLYVALSRHTNPDFIFILHPIVKGDIVVHPAAKAFDDYHYPNHTAHFGISAVDYDERKFN